MEQIKNKLYFRFYIMNRERQPTKRLPRPDLRLNPSKWSAAQSGGIASRVAIIATVTAIFGGIGLVFVYPYFNIERLRKYYFLNRYT